MKRNIWSAVFELEDQPDYYLAKTYPDGGVSGPTRLLGVHNAAHAKRIMKKQKKAHPDWTFFLYEGKSGKPMKRIATGEG